MVTKILFFFFPILHTEFTVCIDFWLNKQTKSNVLYHLNFIIYYGTLNTFIFLNTPWNMLYKFDQLDLAIFTCFSSSVWGWRGSGGIQDPVLCGHDVGRQKSGNPSQYTGWAIIFAITLTLHISEQRLTIYSSYKNIVYFVFICMYLESVVLMVKYDVLFFWFQVILQNLITWWLKNGQSFKHLH